MFIIIVFWLGRQDVIRRRDFFFFVPALFLSILTPLFLISSSVCLSYFILAVPMRECLGKHSCMSCQFPTAILNGTLFYREAKWSLLWQKRRLSKFSHTTTSKDIYEFVYPRHIISPRRVRQTKNSFLPSCQLKNRTVYHYYDFKNHSRKLKSDK